MLLRDPLRLVVPAGHQIARWPSVSLSEVGEERWIVGTRPHPCTDITLAVFATASISPTIVESRRGASAKAHSGQGSDRCR
ncbi:LysR substrate-binding domain-containing protein [Ferrimicrobium sp.]|uniref:LysR substrate-binding domain-containing protein n=1 Tax=Ferrimicrobium acidiphilum TaxID=121039 RepID=A0ABV3XYQ1_9ACTN